MWCYIVPDEPVQPESAVAEEVKQLREQEVSIDESFGMFPIETKKQCDL
jgi:hypothetical protein